MVRIVPGLRKFVRFSDFVYFIAKIVWIGLNSPQTGEILRKKKVLQLNASPLPGPPLFVQTTAGTSSDPLLAASRGAQVELLNYYIPEAQKQLQVF